MEVENWIDQKKELYSLILNFLESEKDSEDEFQVLMKIIDNQEIVKNKHSIKEIFQILYKIGDNHHRTTDFFTRLARIFKYLTKEWLPIDNTEIFSIYKKNKRLLFHLLEHEIITPDASNLQYLNDSKNNYYFFPVIKNLLDEETKKSQENEIKQKFNESIENFESKIKEGEDDSPFCKMI